MMKQILQIVFFLITPGSLVAQYDISGKIIDEREIGVSFANVLLLNAADSSLVKGSITDADGNYSIANVDLGNFIIRSSMVGYEQAFSNVSLSSNSVTVGDLVLNESSTELEAVVVEAEKPLYEQKIDRMIVNVSSSPIMAGNTVLEVLEKSPGVAVNRQNSQVTMNGKNGVSVMINGKMTRMDMQILFNMLSNMPSDNIEKIELITTPPANLDAEGNAGFINLVLKKNDQDGINGSVSGMIGRRTKRVFNVSGAINYRKNKFNAFAEFNYADNPGVLSGNGDNVIRKEQYDFQSTNSLKDYIRPKFVTGRIGVDYYLSEKSIIGILGAMTVQHQQGNGENHAYYDIEPGVDTTFTGVSTWQEFFEQYMYNINFQQGIGDNQQLNIDFDYFTYLQGQPRTYGYQFTPENQQSSILEDLYIKKKTPIDIWVGKLDYKIDISDQLVLEAGVKSTLNDVENDVLAERLESGTRTIDPLFTSFTRMNEDIIAGYTSLSAKFSDLWSLKAGLRYEHTVTDIRDEQGDQLVYRKYGNFFPTSYLSVNLSKFSKLNFAYSYRISRPTFFNLAPFILFGDANTLWTGNPNLLPALNHSFRTNYSYKGINLSLSFDQVSDNIAEFQAIQIPNTNITQFSAINIDRKNLWNLSISLPITVTKWWEMTNSFIGMNTHMLTTYFDEYKDISNTSFMLNTTQSFLLPGKYSVQVSGVYRSRRLLGLALRDPNGMVTLGVRKVFEKNRGTINLNFTDIFRTNNFKRAINTPESDYYVISELYFDVQAIRLTYTNSFGNNKLKSRSKRQTGSAEDLKRL
ncbi:MAG: outer membrane beta-barrel protein [Bacteroidota bacterium]